MVTQQEPIAVLMPARYAASVHPHGVMYDKASEGAPYKDGTTDHGDDVVKPNTTYTYTWKV
jgi:hephaestin